MKKKLLAIVMAACTMLFFALSVTQYDCASDENGIICIEPSYIKNPPPDYED